jgi:hypothetical protein
MPDEAAELMIKLLSVQKRNGSAMHQFNPMSMVAGEGDSLEREDRPHYYSDDHLWIVLAVCWYLKETGDRTFLDRSVPFYEKDKGGLPAESAPVLEHLRRALRFTASDLGPHGLPLLGFADWNDTVNLAAGAESVFTACLYGTVLRELIELSETTGDTVAAMLGDMTYVTGYLDAPETMRKLLSLCARTRLAVIARLQAAIPSWRGIHAAGGYPSMVLSRRTVAYHQEDSAALLNPSIFRTFILPALRIGRGAADVNFIHLHSACLYPVDILLEDDTFDVLQINIDHRGTGPPVCRLIDTFKKIQAAGRPLLLWGEFTPEEWQLIQSQLSPVGLSLQPIVSHEGAVRESQEAITDARS